MSSNANSAMGSRSPRGSSATTSSARAASKRDTPAYLQPTASSRRKAAGSGSPDSTAPQSQGSARVDLQGSGASTSTFPNFQRLSSSRRSFQASSSISSLNNGAGGVTPNRSNPTASATTPRASGWPAPSGRSATPTNPHASRLVRSDTNDARGGARKQSVSSGNLPPLSPSASLTAGLLPQPGRVQTASSRARGGNERRESTSSSGTDSARAGGSPASSRNKKSKTARRGSSNRMEESAEEWKARLQAERQAAITASLLCDPGAATHPRRSSLSDTTGEVAAAAATSASRNGASSPVSGHPGVSSSGTEPVVHVVALRAEDLQATADETEQYPSPRTTKNIVRPRSASLSTANTGTAVVTPSTFPPFEMSAGNTPSKQARPSTTSTGTSATSSAPHDRDDEVRRRSAMYSDTTEGLESPSSCLSRTQRGLPAPLPAPAVVLSPPAHSAWTPRSVVEKRPPATPVGTPRTVDKLRRPVTPRTRASATAAAPAAGEVPASVEGTQAEGAAGDGSGGGTGSGVNSHRHTPVKQTPRPSLGNTTPRSRTSQRNGSKEASSALLLEESGNEDGQASPRASAMVWVAMPPSVRSRASAERQPSATPSVEGADTVNAGEKCDENKEDTVAAVDATIVAPIAIGDGSPLPRVLATSSTANTSDARESGSPSAPGTDNRYKAVGNDSQGASDVLSPAPAPPPCARRGHRNTEHSGHEGSHSNGSYEDMDSDAEEPAQLTSALAGAATPSTSSHAAASLSTNNVSGRANRVTLGLPAGDNSITFDSFPGPSSYTPSDMDQHDEAAPDEDEFSLLLEETVRQGGLSDLTGHSPLSPKQRLRIQTEQRLEREKRRRRLNPSVRKLRSSYDLRRRSSTSSRCTSGQHSPPITSRNGSPMYSTAPSPTENDGLGSAGMSLPGEEASLVSVGTSLPSPVSAATTKGTVPGNPQIRKEGPTNRSTSRMTKSTSQLMSGSDGNSGATGREPSTSTDWITTEEKILTPTPYVPPVNDKGPRPAFSDAASPLLTMTSPAVLVQSATTGERARVKVKAGDANGVVAVEGSTPKAASLRRKKESPSVASSTATAPSRDTPNLSEESTTNSAASARRGKSKPPGARGGSTGATPISSDAPAEGLSVTAASAETKATASLTRPKGSASKKRTPASPGDGAGDSTTAVEVEGAATSRSVLTARRPVADPAADSTSPSHAANNRAAPLTPRGTTSTSATAGSANRKLSPGKSSGALSTTPAAQPAAVTAGARKSVSPTSPRGKPTKADGPASAAAAPGTSSPTTAVVRQVLIPLLASPAEKERTVTIVFDLDETLCNNHRMGPALLRPGAIQVLKYLRSLYPHPLYKVVPGKTGSAATTERLYGDAFKYSGIAAKAPTASCTSADADLDYPGLRLEMVLWTASVEAYARPVVARLDPNGDIFDQLIFRDIRWYSNMDYTKELCRLGRSMDRCVIIENAPASVYMNRHNAILVHDFVSNRQDRELYVVKALLTEFMERVHTLLMARAREAAAASKPLDLSPPGSPASSPLDAEASEDANDSVATAEGEEDDAQRASETAQPPPHGRESGGPRPSTENVAMRRESLARRQSVHERLSSQRNLIKRSTRPTSASTAAHLPTLNAALPPRPSTATTITSFLAQHSYIVPTTNYVKFTAVAHEMRRLRAEKSAAAGGAADVEDDMVDSESKGSTRGAQTPRVRPRTTPTTAEPGSLSSSQRPLRKTPSSASPVTVKATPKSASLSTTLSTAEDRPRGVRDTATAHGKSSSFVSAASSKGVGSRRNSVVQ